MLNPFKLRLVIIETVFSALYFVLIVASSLRFIGTIIQRRGRKNRGFEAKHIENGDRVVKPFFFLFIGLVSGGRLAFFVMDIISHLSTTQGMAELDGLTTFLELAPGLLYVNIFFLLLLSWARKYHLIRYYYHSSIYENDIYTTPKSDDNNGENEESDIGVLENHQSLHSPFYFNNFGSHYANTGSGSYGIIMSPTDNNLSPENNLDERSSLTASINSRTAIAEKEEEYLNTGDRYALMFMKSYFVICQVLIFILFILVVILCAMKSATNYVRTERFKSVESTIMDILFAVMIIIAATTWLLFLTYSILLLLLVRKMSKHSIFQFFNQMRDTTPIDLHQNEMYYQVPKQQFSTTRRNDTIMRTVILVTSITIMCTFVLLMKISLFAIQFIIWLHKGDIPVSKLFSPRFLLYTYSLYYIALEILPLFLLTILTFRRANKTKKESTNLSR
jgi:hypothetical protein